MKQRAENRYDLVDGMLVFRLSTTEDDDRTRLVTELCELISRFWTKSKHVQTHAMRSVTVLSARNTAKAVTEQSVRYKAVRSVGRRSSQSQRGKSKDKGRAGAQV